MSCCLTFPYSFSVKVTPEDKYSWFDSCLECQMQVLVSLPQKVDLEECRLWSQIIRNMGQPTLEDQQAD